MNARPGGFWLGTESLETPGAFAPEETNSWNCLENRKIDWLGKKWYFLGFSLIFSVAGVLSLFFRIHLAAGRRLPAVAPQCASSLRRRRIINRLRDAAQKELD